MAQKWCKKWPKMVQKWKPIFFHIQCEKIFDGTLSDLSWTKNGPRRILQFSLLASLGAILDRFQFFGAALWAPLGAVRVRSGCPRRPPQTLLETSYAGKTHNSASYAIKSITSKLYVLRW